MITVTRFRKTFRMIADSFPSSYSTVYLSAQVPTIEARVADRSKR